MSKKRADHWPKIPKYQPFPELPPMTLRLFNIREGNNLMPTTRGGDWEGYRRYDMFRQGIAQLLKIRDDDWRYSAGKVACRILRPELAPHLFNLEPGVGLTYHGEVESTHAARLEAQQVRASQIKMQVVDVMYAVSQGDMPDAWQALHDQTIELHREVRGDI